MSVFTRELLATAASSPRHLTGGTFADPVRLSWQDVHEQAKRIGGGLAARGVGRGGSVAVLATDAADVAPLAQAAWLRGVALTMLQQPTPRTDLTVWLADTVRAIGLIKADVVVVGGQFLAALDHLSAQQLAVCTVESLRTAEPAEFDAETDDADIALRQLTSGSTGVPKAVEISHGNLAASAIALHDGLDLDISTDVFASWLPLSHDMGMIAFLCLPMQLGLEVAIIPPDEFLRRPIIWAELISRHRGTITSGPNFAYSVLARVLQRRTDPGNIDLSSLRVAVNGAEPIDHHDIAEFATVGARFGMRTTAAMPGYGLAEATLVVSLGAPHDPAVIDKVSRRAVVEAHRALPICGASEHLRHVVCVGAPVTGMEVRISRDGQALAHREIGAIELRGPTVAENYLTSAGVVPLARDDGWFDTGDLGYLDEHGRLYVCGRSKDLIVLAGSNLYPHDIERAAETVDGVRKGCVIAVRVDGDPEGFAVLAEVHNADAEDVRLRISRAVTARVSRHVGHLPRHVLLLPAGSLPKTASGKLCRSSARELLPASRPMSDVRRVS
ncbi:MAG: fatty-acyl-CoA synthase [Mycobacterium sp.]|nr:fatty-acyl-CoA synthase [Mycobacterium sp.]